MRKRGVAFRWMISRLLRRWMQNRSDDIMCKFLFNDTFFLPCCLWFTLYFIGAPLVSEQYHLRTGHVAEFKVEYSVRSGSLLWIAGA